MDSGVDQQGQGATQLRKTAEDGALDRATSDGVQIGHVAPLRAETLSEGAEQGDRIADAIGEQQGPDRLIARAFTSAGVDRDAAGQIQYRNDLHPAYYPRRESDDQTQWSTDCRLGHRGREHQGRPG